MRKIGIVIVLFLLAVTGIGGHVFYQVSKNIKNTIPVYEQPIDFPTYPQLNLREKTPKEMEQIKQGELLIQAGIAFK